MSDIYTIKGETLTSIADAVREMTATEGQIAFRTIPEAIRSIEAAVSKLPSTVESEVNFLDYDGTVLYSYTVAEAAELTELPPLPSHDGLVCQGWNWNLESIQKCGRPVNVGASYVTDDGATRLHIHVRHERRVNFTLYLHQSVDEGFTVNWGDGSDVETLTGEGDTTISHKYGAVGKYTISIARAKEDAELTLGWTVWTIGGYTIFGYNDGVLSPFLETIESVNLGSDTVAISAFAFQSCSNLTSVTIPEGVTEIGSYALSDCSNLTSVTIPASVTEFATISRQNDSSLLG